MANLNWLACIQRGRRAKITYVRSGWPRCLGDAGEVADEELRTEEEARSSVGHFCIVMPISMEIQKDST